ncbi:MAG: hypothetical protein PHX83_11770 [Acidobacteriia bacterium]|nr:hypothetical protein [Terriglobia bacterium]
MEWTRIILATLAGGIGATLTDWVFFGILFHDKNKAFPEVWRRPEGGKGETQAVVIATLLGFLTCFCFVFLCSRTAFIQWVRTWKMAVGLWLMIPVPILVSQHLWMKVHPLVTLTHALGWLAKLLVAAAVVAWLLI